MKIILQLYKLLFTTTKTIIIESERMRTYIAWFDSPEDIIKEKYFLLGIV